MAAEPDDLEARQRQALRRTRAVATGLLLTMAAIVIGTGLVAEPTVWTSLAHAAAEAGVVGGLADWFAVTALFRRPLGLPIPHTAIVPRNKNRIGEGLGAFLERHFLTNELLSGKLRAFDAAQRLATWLSEPDNSTMAADQVVRMLPYAVAALDDAELRAFTAKALGMRLRDIDAAPVLALALRLLTAGGYHGAVLDRALKLGREFLDRNASEIEQAAAEGPRRRWWIPAAVNKRIARAILNGLGEVLDELQSADSVMRRRALDAVTTLADELAISPEYRAKIETAKRDLLDRPEMQQWLGSAWDQIRDAVLGDVTADPDYARAGLANVLTSAGQSLLADDGIRARLNASIEHAVLSVVPWRGELARFVADVVHRWDEKVLVQRMELALGADLQYVRFTGTLVGAAVGCVLYLLELALREPVIANVWQRMLP
ncbi:MAG TPA: DUF445 family protein [Alphaproteobacteria bacterium]|nr:DUF445 family protein [Alphaproteobacteria bacterium]